MDDMKTIFKCSGGRIIQEGPLSQSDIARSRASSKASASTSHPPPAVKAASSTDNTLTMTADEIVTDPFLRSVLVKADEARKQCLVLLDLLDQHPRNPGSPTPKEVELEISKQQQLLNAYLIQARNLNRRAIFSTRQTKQTTAEARHEIDTLHLQLQNLYYEQRHLRGEIGACEGYDHTYQQLPLIPAEDFVDKFPEHSNADENALMVARIEHEHAERRELEKQRQALLTKKQGLIAENKKRKDDLAKLDRDLEKFIEAAEPIAKIFEQDN